MAQIDHLQHELTGVAFQKIVLDELSPFFTLLLARFGKAVARQIDEIERRQIGFNLVVVELAGLPRLRAGARKIFAADDAIDKRRLSDIRATAEANSG